MKKNILLLLTAVLLLQSNTTSCFLSKVGFNTDGNRIPIYATVGTLVAVGTYAVLSTSKNNNELWSLEDESNTIVNNPDQDPEKDKEEGKATAQSNFQFNAECAGISIVTAFGAILGINRFMNFWNL